MSPERTSRANSEALSVANNTHVTRDKRGKIRWSVLRDTPEQLQKFIEDEAQRVKDSGENPSYGNLLKLGMSSLGSAIQLYYPGSFYGLREKLGLEVNQRPANFWKRPEAVVIMKEEAMAFFKLHGTLTFTLLKKEGKGDLAQAIRKYYPGGWSQFCGDEGYNLSIKPKGYWTADRIKNEGDAFYSTHGVLSKSVLRQHGRADLASAVRRYPGGIEKLKSELGIKSKTKPHGYWTPERIKDEAQSFQRSIGSLSQSRLLEQGRFDLVHAIWLKYPGGIWQLYKDLGREDEEMRKPMGYWTPETIKKEAKEFYEQHKTISYALLKRDRGNLCVAIEKKYPGGLRQLKNDISLVIDGQQQTIFPEQANEQLRKMLEI